MSTRFAGRSGCGLVVLECTCGWQLVLHACLVEWKAQDLQALSTEQVAPSSSLPQDDMNRWLGDLACCTPSLLQGLETEPGGYRWGKHCSFCRHDRHRQIAMLKLCFCGRRQPVTL